MSKPALIVVDVQKDFLPGGALAVPLGHQCIHPIVNLAKSGAYRLIIATRDWHPPDHCSFSDDPKYTHMSWPSHCVQGTPGAELDEEIAALNPVVFDKGTQTNEECLSGFSADLALLLDQKRVSDVTITGLATDYCVKATALDALNAGFDVTVPIEATMPIAWTTGALAVGQMKARGVWIESLDNPRLTC